MKPNTNKGQNGNECCQSQTDIGTSFEPPAFDRLTFERWLRTLESCPDLLVLEAKTPHEIERYKFALRQWKQAGFPSPIEPPEEWRLQVSAYTRKWMQQWYDEGKQDFLPLHPHRLISLWNMIQFPATPLLCALTDLNYLTESLSFQYSATDPKDRAKWLKQSKTFEHIVSQIGELAKGLELTETYGRCVRFCKIISASVTEMLPGTGIFKELTSPQLRLEIEGIEETLQKELSDRQFVYVPASKSKFCEQAALFGGEVKQACSTEFNAEIKDVGNCLAVDLNTAAIFHLMRVAEFGMRALARHLKIKVKRNTIDSAGWTEIIKNIEDATAARWKNLPKAKKARKKATDFLKFCEVATDELNVFKEIWRNNVMHASGSYKEAEAMYVFKRVEDFMQRLAKRIPIR